jgi:hypothetical protein
MVGLITAGLASWAHLGLPGDAFKNEATRQFVQYAGQTVQPAVLPFAAFGGYFGLVFALSGLANLAARDRKARFRFWPVAWTGLVAGLVGSVLPSPQPWATVALASMAAVAQVSSPWCRESAAYARYRAALGCRRAA